MRRWLGRVGVETLLTSSRTYLKEGSSKTESPSQPNSGRMPPDMFTHLLTQPLRSTKHGEERLAREVATPLATSSPSAEWGLLALTAATAWCQNLRKNWGQNLRNPPREPTLAGNSSNQSRTDSQNLVPNSESQSLIGWHEVPLELLWNR